MSLAIVVKRAADLTADEQAQVDLVDHLAFSAPGAGVEDLDGIEWSPAEWFVLGCFNGQVISLLGVQSRVVHAGEQAVLVAGVGGVCTHSDWQRQGFAGAILERAAVFMRDEMKAQFGLLVCSPSRAPYYAKFGWQAVSDPMQFDLCGEKQVFHGKTMVLPLVGLPWPAGTVDLRGKPW